MTIDKINRIQGPTPAGDNQPVRPNSAPERDELKLSGSALQKMELQRVLKIVEERDEIRADKVAQAKAHLAEYMKGSQIDPGVLDAMLGGGKLLNDLDQEISALMQARRARA